MLLIPELETVVILVPRTGSSTLRRAVAARYPRSILLYRHMEADGVPAGYDRWRKVGVVRRPLSRLWSLYQFLSNGQLADHHDAAWRETMQRSTGVSFNDWLTDNREVFTSPYDYSGGLRFWPERTVLHPLPENRKSQYVYLRPDLGTVIYQYDQLEVLARVLDVDLSERHNGTKPAPIPPLSQRAMDHIRKVCVWDLEHSMRLRCGDT